ncbi:MAG: hypothetical protein HZB55_21490 [Deltaproteobacteria bacterium]|nr:hypothetical protein [Deltaproteobacteria bacterium]
MNSKPFPDVREVVARAAQHEQSCILCGIATRCVGMFRPDNPGFFTPLAPPAPGKERLILYRLCPECVEVHGKRKVADLVERALLVAGTRGTKPENVIDVSQWLRSVAH